MSASCIALTLPDCKTSKQSEYSENLDLNPSADPALFTVAMKRETRGSSPAARVLAQAARTPDRIAYPMVPVDVLGCGTL